MSRPRDDEPGLFEALRRIGSSLFDTAQNRVELASIELAEARERLVFTIIASVVIALLFGGVGLALSAWVAAALWPTLGPAVLAWIALAYGVAGVALFLWLRARLRNDPPLLASTLAELRQDAALLRGTRREG